MLSNVEHWLISVAVLIALLVVLAACICGCRKKVPKNELLGLAGMVKITNPEENLDHNYRQENGSSVISDNNRICVDTSEAHRRAPTTTANRSLPDIPIDPERIQLDNADTVWEGNEPNSDTCSALYATVTENKNAAHLLNSGAEMQLAGVPREALASGTAASDDGKSSEYSSLSQTDDGFSPYAQLKGEHPYDRLRKSEHPYAQVGAGSLRSALPAVAGRPRSSAPAGGGFVNPVPPPRTRKSNSFHSEPSSSGGDEPMASGSDIAAATAITGRVAANQDLPYMTPPIPTPAMVSEPQTHFSGDSQDSSKGYTSISVREPLANIKAQIRQQSRTRELLDDVYTTVSDDSEEVYADIEDPQAVYTSGSETYAQIQPLTIAQPSEVSSKSSDEGPHVPPQPPSVDSLKHVAQVHSRQASSSSAASSVANLGSPKPEKRQANSPLPPPPAISPELYATVDKKSIRDTAAAEKTLEEMYAKVMKRNQRIAAKQEIMPEVVDTGTESDVAATVTNPHRLSSSSRTHSTESEPTSDDHLLGEDINGSLVDFDSSRESVAIHPTKEKLDIDRDSLCSFNSEIQPDLSSSKADESDNSRHPYQQLPATNSDLPNYESLESVKSIPYTDPGYEMVQRPSGPSVSDSDPNYEELRPQTSATRKPEKTSASSASITSGRDATASEPGYASIGYTEPSYEKVRSKSLEPSYAKINKKRRSTNSVYEEPNYASIHQANDDASSTFGSEADPNYETVMHPSPNYESVNFSNIPIDPPYERLTNSRDSVNDVSPGFSNTTTTEKEERRQSSTSETDYEEVSAQRTSANTDSWEMGRHKLI